MLDTNILLDFMLSREPHNTDAQKLMLLGYVKEAELWVSGAQINDLFYVLTDGGKPALNDSAKQSLKKLRQCVHIYKVGEPEVDATLNSNWTDLEDACLYHSALNLKADFIVTRNQKDFSLSSIKVLNAEELFAHLKENKKLTYQVLSLIEKGV